MERGYLEINSHRHLAVFDYFLVEIQGNLTLNYFLILYLNFLISLLN